MEEKKGCSGCLIWILLIFAALFILTWMNAANVAKTAAEGERVLPTQAVAATEASAIPGSAAEAVQKGELTMADIKHRADALGWSTDAWQEWYYIASQTGTQMEDIEDAAKNINEKLAAEDAEFLLALAELGISKEDAKAMKPEELFEKVIYGLQEIED